jgi:hypothetical protein
MPLNESDFQRWYGDWSKKSGMNPNPDDPQHFYDYRAAFEAGVIPPEPGGHWPSQYKKEGHPRMVIDGINTKTGKPAINANDVTWDEKDITWDESNVIPRSTGQKIAGAIAPYARPVLEAGGAIGGGFLGSVGPGAGTVLGAGLGYAGGRQAANLLEEYAGQRKPPTLGQAAWQAVADVPVGMAIESGGQIVGKAAGAVTPYLQKGAAKMYQSALKPLTTLSEREVGKRVSTGLQEGIPVSKGGLEKSKDAIGTLNKEITTRIKNLQGSTVSREASLQPVKDYYAQVPSKNITPTQEQEIIARYIKDVKDVQPEDIPIQQAQVFKQTLNKELDEYYNRLSRGQVAPQDVLMKTKAAMADGLRKEISEIAPEVQILNQREASLIQFNKSLDRAVKRINNREIIPLAVQMASGQGSAAALKSLAVKIIDQPYMKSQLSFLLYKANGQMMTQLGKGIMLSSMQQSPEEAQKQGGAVMSKMNPVSTAQASPLSDYAARNRQVLEGEYPESPSPQVAQPKAPPPKQYTTVAPAKVKQLSNGKWVRWDDNEQAWIPTEAKAEGGDVDEEDGPIIVGEKGPEVFVPKGKGKIIPNKSLRSQLKDYKEEPSDPSDDLSFEAPKLSFGKEETDSIGPSEKFLNLLLNLNDLYQKIPVNDFTKDDMGIKQLIPEELQNEKNIPYTKQDRMRVIAASLANYMSPEDQQRFSLQYLLPTQNVTPGVMATWKFK